MISCDKHCVACKALNTCSRALIRRCLLSPGFDRAYSWVWRQGQPLWSLTAASERGPYLSRVRVPRGRRKGDECRAIHQQVQKTFQGPKIFCRFLLGTHAFEALSRCVRNLVTLKPPHQSGHGKRSARDRSSQGAPPSEPTASSSLLHGIFGGINSDCEWVSLQRSQIPGVP